MSLIDAPNRPVDTPCPVAESRGALLRALPVGVRTVRKGTRFMRRLVSPYRLISIAGLWLALASSGCAGPNSIAATAPRVPFETLDQKQNAQLLMGLQEHPIVIHFKEGQEIPFHFVLDS